MDTTATAPTRTGSPAKMIRLLSILVMLAGLVMLIAGAVTWFTVQSNLADGAFSVEITNEHIVKTSEHGHGPIGTFTAGCFIPSPSLGAAKPVKVSTVAGVAQLAEAGELYFNLHTTGQTYFGDLRGQIGLADPVQASQSAGGN